MAGASSVLESYHARGTLAARHTLLSLVVFVAAFLLQGCVAQSSRDDITRQEVFVGDNITLNCLAKPNQLISYRWVYVRLGTNRPQVLSRGRRLDVQEPRFSLKSRVENGRVNLELTLSDVRSHESGLFMCWRQGQKPDPQVVVTVLEHGSQSERQSITRTESPKTVQYGESATFSCFIKPAWPIRVSWLKDGRFISLRDRLYTQTKRQLRGNPQAQDQDARDDQLVASLFVASVRRDATFTCRIETNPPDEQNMPITVRVPRVESLTAEPNEDVVEYGQPLSLACTISGSNNEVVWLKDGSELLFGPDFPGRRKQSVVQAPNRLVSTVHFKAMSFADNGQYVCYIPGASSNILINIEGRSPRLLGIAGGNFFEDEDLTLRCTTQYTRNAGTRQEVSWTFEGAVLDPSSYESLTYAGEHNTTIHQLSLSRASARNIGTYQCITPYGSKQIAVEMYIPPSLKEPLPSEVPFTENEFFRLPCHTTGYPEPSVHWERKKGSEWVPVEGGTGAGSAELVFPRASVGDAGAYRCVAKSEAGSFLAEVAAVVGRVDPEILEIVAPESVAVGDNFTVQCTLRNWEGEVEFTLNGVSLMSALAERFNVLRYPMEEKLMEAFLIVRDSMPEDSGQYQCRAGLQVSPPAPVLVKEPEPEVLDLSASPVVMGREFSLKCVVTNWDEPVTFVFNNKVVELEEEGWQYSMVEGVEGEDTPPRRIFTHILTVPSASVLHNGRYECYTGPSASASFNVNVWDIPEVTLELQNERQRNWRDTPTPMNCKIKGVSPDMVTVVFSHESSPQVSIENRTKMSTSSQLVNVAVSEGKEGDEPHTVFTLGFYSLSKDFEGLWSCEVFHPSGISLNKDTFHLEIYEPPKFVNAPPEVVFQEEGNDLRLNCSVSGPPDTMVAWYRQGIQEPIVFDLLSALLFIPRFTTTDEGQYVCRAASHDREILTTTHLRLGTPQPLVESMVVSPAVIGQDFNVTCTFSNWNREVLFFHNSEAVDLQPGSRYSVQQQRPGPGAGHTNAVSHVLTVASAAATDSGVMECFLTTDIFRSIDIAVKESHTLLPTPVTIDEFELLRPTLPSGRIVELTGPESVLEGGELLLTCLVSPVVQQDIVLIHSTSYLYVGNITLVEDPRVEILPDVASDGSKLIYLRISDVKEMDEGTYQCAASTEPPAYSSLTVSVVVPQRHTELPQISTTNLPDTLPTKDIPEQLAALPGDDVTFHCSVPAVIDFNEPLSQRQHYISWNRMVHRVPEIIVDNNEIVHLEADRMTVNYAVDKDTGMTTYDLTLKRVEAADSGKYVCSSTRRLAVDYEDSKTYHLSVEAPGSCEFPSDWLGQWYDTKYRQVSDIAFQEFKRSSCLLKSGGNFIIQHNRRQCYRCVYFSQRHQNLLQYKISKCKKKLEVDSLCSSTEKNGFINLVRIDTKAVGCPFTGPRKYLLELQQQACTDDPSLISSSTASLLKFQYPTCWVLRDPSRPVAEEFECVADWSDDTTHYLITRLLTNSSMYLEQKYRCFTYTQEQGGEYAYLMGHNNAPLCGDIGESFALTYKISELIGESPLSVTGNGVKDIIVQSSEVVVLPCRASVLLGSEDPSKKYMITWVREVSGGTEVVSRDDFLAMGHDRYTLDIATLRPGNTSKYDLIIANAQPSDAGTYHCLLRNRKGGGQGVSHNLSLTVEESPKFEKCALPVHWSGEWWTKDGDIPIGGGIFGEIVCDMALGDKYFMRGPTCNMCYMIKETHFNLLHFKKSPCERNEDLNSLCSMVEEQPREALIRKDVGITCPFPGSRSFVYEQPHDTCEETHSQLLSNGTQLHFLYNQCHSPRDSDSGSASTLVQCVAIWSEGSTHYLMGKVAHDEGGYQCFTFEEAMNQDHLFTMGRAETEVCRDLAASEANTLYQIFGESKAPEAPIIEGDEASRQVLLGDAVTLTCSCRGGVPPPTLRWYRVVDGSRKELPSEKLVYEGFTRAELHIKVDASDKNAEYFCEASNFATEAPLNASTTLTFLRDYASMMLQQVVVVEYQPAFLPCVQTLEDDLEMSWFDADLELKITSGNESEIQDPNIVPYIHDGVMGLMITSSFLDTTYSCSINNVTLGSTTLIIYPKYLVLEESEVADPLKYFVSSRTEVQPPLSHPATLDCSVASNVTSSLVSWWRYPGTTLLTQGSINFAEQDGYKLDVSNNSYLLTVPNATLKHSGLYICQVALNEVELYRRNFSINVEGLLTTQLGENVSIGCYSPKGKNVNFLYNGKELMVSDENTTNKYVLEISESDDEGAVFTLTVTDVMEEDCGVYTCVSAEHPDHVLQETSVSILGEVTSLITTSTLRTTTTSLITTSTLRTTTQESTTLATTKMPSTVTESTTPHDDDYYPVDYKDMDDPEVTETTTMKTVPTTEGTSSTTATIPPTDTATSIYTTADPVTTTPMPTTFSVPTTAIPTTTPMTTTTTTTTTTTSTTTTEPPMYEEITLSCKGYDSEYTIWDYNGRTLFLGPIDMAGILGTSLSNDGDLVLIAGPYPNLRDNDTYSCYFESEESGEEEPAPVLVVMYHLTLVNDVAMVDENLVGPPNGIPLPEPEPEPKPVVTPEPLPDFQFSGLKEEEVAILANSERIGNNLMKILQDGGLNVRLLDTLCQPPNSTRGWQAAKTAQEVCEDEARSTGDLGPTQSVFIGIDFFVEVVKSSWFAVTQLYVNNIKFNVSMNVFAPMSPVPSSNIIPSYLGYEPPQIEVTESWWNTVQGVDNPFSNSLLATIHVLQESYLNSLKENGAF